MKNFLYSTLAVTCAITGIASSRANTNYHRTWWIYKYIGTYPITTLHQITLTSNWTHIGTLPSCTGSIQGCAVTATIPPTLVGLKDQPKTKIPAQQTVTGVNPRFTAKIGSGVTTVFSKINQ